MSDTSTNRRWFRFKLRTLLVLFTVICCVLGWLGHSARWIDQRRQFRANPPTPYLHMNGGGRAPWSLRLLGESGWAEISISFIPWAVWDDPGYQESPLSPKEREQLNRVKRLFPEAIVATTPLDGRRPRTTRRK